MQSQKHHSRGFDLDYFVKTKHVSVLPRSYIDTHISKGFCGSGKSVLFF